MDSAFAWVFGKLWRRYLLCHIVLRNLYLGGFAFPQHSPSTFYRGHANSIKTVTNSTVREWASEGVSERARTQVSKSKFSFISGLQRKIPSSRPMHISRNEIRRWMLFFLLSLTGVELIKSACVRVDDESLVSDHFCEGRRPVDETIKCNTHKCPARWECLFAEDNCNYRAFQGFWRNFVLSTLQFSFTSTQGKGKWETL